MRLSLIILSAWVSLGAGEVVAQDAPPECEELWRQAREARASGNLVEARRFLEETMECSPSVSAAFNLAAVLRDMGRYSDAQHYLLGLLDGQFGELPAERRGIVESEVERVEGSLGMIEVTVEPAAELRLNGSEYGTFRGARVLTLDPGEWSLELRADGFRSHSEQILLESGQRMRLNYRLEVEDGNSEIEAGERDGDEAPDDSFEITDDNGSREDEPLVESRSLLPRRLGIAALVVGVVAALTIGLVVRGNNRAISDPFFGNPST